MAPFLIGPPPYKPVNPGRGRALSLPEGIVYPPFMWRLAEKYRVPIGELNENMDLLDMFIETEVHAYLSDLDTPPPSPRG